MADTVKLIVERKKGKPRGSTHQLKPHQFQPGQSGNPAGRPKGSSSRTISAAYNAILHQQVPADVRDKLGVDPEAECSWADLIAIQMVRKAVETDDAKINFGAVTELRETTEGKTPDRSEVAGAGGAPLAGAPVFAVNFVKPDGGEPNAN